MHVSYNIGNASSIECIRLLHSNICRNGHGTYLDSGIIAGIENLEPNLSEAHGRDLQIHILVGALEGLEGGVGHLGAHEEVEDGGVVVRTEDHSLSLGIGDGKYRNVREPLLDLLFGHGRILFASTSGGSSGGASAGKCKEQMGSI